MYDRVWRLLWVTILKTVIFLCLFPNIQGIEVEDPPNFINGNGVASLSLENYSPYNQVSWSVGILTPQSEVAVEIKSIPSNIQFFVFQAHAYLYNVTLSYNATLTPHFYVNGTNLGLVWQPKLPSSIFHVINDNLENVTVMFAVVAYGPYAPIPGGCNMEFDVETAPYLRLQHREATVVVNAQAARSRSSPCEKMTVTHDMYRMYLPERDFSPESYFSALRSMLTPSDVISNGTLASVPLVGSSMRRVYSSYPGIGSVHVVLAKTSSGEAAYVPAITYSCSALYFTDSCTVLTSTFSKVLSALVLFLGLFACYSGHSFFKTEIFLVGSLAGGLLSYIAVRQLTTLSPSLSLYLSSVLGAATGMVWLLFWCFYGIPVIVILLFSLTLGFVFASLVFYAGLGDLSFAQMDLDFWLTFCLLMVSVAVLLVPLSHRASIVVSAILGAYAVVVPIDHYVGSNLKYIVINTLRRGTVDGFNMAILGPPFQFRDGLLVALWFILATTGGYMQMRWQRGRPPFAPATYQRPSPRRRTLASPGPGRGRGPGDDSPRPLLTDAASPHPNVSERTPLKVSSYIPYLYGSVGDDDVFETPPGETRPFTFSRWINSWRERRRL